MTKEEFNNTEFGAIMKAKYRGDTYYIISVNSYEQLLELECELGESLWVRCENLTIT